MTRKFKAKKKLVVKRKPRPRCKQIQTHQFGKWTIPCGVKVRDFGLIQTDLD